MNTFWERELTNNEKKIIKGNKKSILKKTLLPEYKMNLFFQFIVLMGSVALALFSESFVAEYIKGEILVYAYVVITWTIFKVTISFILNKILYLIISSFRFSSFFNSGKVYVSKGCVVSYEQNKLRFFDTNVMLDGKPCYIDWFMSDAENKSKPSTKELIILYKENGMCLPVYVNENTKAIYDSLSWRSENFYDENNLQNIMINNITPEIIPHPNAINAKQSKRKLNSDEITKIFGKNKLSQYIFKHTTAIKTFFIAVIPLILAVIAVEIFTDDLAPKFAAIIIGGIIIYFALLIFITTIALEKKNKVEYTIRPMVYLYEIKGDFSGYNKQNNNPNYIMTKVLCYIYEDEQFNMLGRVIPTGNFWGGRKFKYGELVYFIEYAKDDGVLISSDIINAKYGIK